jgi:hypothetical protein
VHINAVGNWTNSITALLNPEKKIGVVQEDLLEAPYPLLSPYPPLPLILFSSPLPSSPRKGDLFIFYFFIFNAQ